MATYGAGVIIGKTATGELTNYGTVGFLAMAVIFGSIFIARYVKPIDAKIEPKLETKPTPSAVTAE
jgi:hypothetical protein